MHANDHLDLLYPKDRMMFANALEKPSKSKPIDTSGCIGHSATWLSRRVIQSTLAQFDKQIATSKGHTDNSRRTLEKSAKRFTALASIEKWHAAH